MSTSRIFVVAALALLPTLACAQAERGDTGEIETAGSVDAFTLRVGDCYNDQFSLSGDVYDVPGVPCSEPHDNEVYAVFDLPMEEWPGEERVQELGDKGCLARFESAIGIAYQESILYITTLVPTAGSWAEREDREVICAAYHMEEEKLTGSVLGSGW